MNPTVRIEAIDMAGELLSEAEFTVFINGRRLAATERGRGFATIQLSGPIKKLEVEARYKGDKQRIRVDEDAMVVQISFDPNRRPPPKPDVPQDVPPQGPCTHRGRWGGRSELSGRRLSAVVTDRDDEGFFFDLVIEATDNTTLQPPIRFHVHEDFARDWQDINKHSTDGRSARWKDNWAEEAYVAAAQVRDASGSWVGLEFDLNELLTLPQSLKDPKWVAWDRERRRGNNPNRKSDSESKKVAMKLSGSQIQTLRKGLEQSFVGFNEFAVFLREQTDRHLISYAALNDPRPIFTFRVIEGAEAEGWLDKLLVAAIATRPHRPEFAQVATELGLTAAGPNLTNARPINGTPDKGAQKALEDIVFGRERFVDVDAFLADMSAAQSRICAISLPDPEGVKFGTGFLVGPDLVLTNFHVLSQVIAGKSDPSDVELRFDLRMTPDGKTLRPGVSYRLHAREWLVDKSPFSDNDLRDPLPADPAPDELDYCLVRLAKKAGEERSGGSADSNANKRGWLELSSAGSAGTANDNIFIMQHPYDKARQKSHPLKLAIGNHLGFTGGGMRMRYDADTLGGSSGSPIFNADLEVIGLHHRGDPNADLLKMTAKHNQGIPIRRIIELLESRGIERFWT